MAKPNETILIDPSSVAVHECLDGGGRELVINGRAIGWLIPEGPGIGAGALVVEIHGGGGAGWLIRPTPCARSWMKNLKGYSPIPEAIECFECGGEGGHEGPITCGGRCDWCGGHRDQSEACDTCEGACEVELDAESCHATAPSSHAPGDHCEHWHDDLSCCHCGGGGEAVAVAS